MKKFLSLFFLIVSCTKNYSVSKSENNNRSRGIERSTDIYSYAIDISKLEGEFTSLKLEAEQIPNEMKRINLYIEMIEKLIYKTSGKANEVMEKTICNLLILHLISIFQDEQSLKLVSDFLQNNMKGDHVDKAVKEIDDFTSSKLDKQYLITKVLSLLKSNKDTLNELFDNFADKNIDYIENELINIEDIFKIISQITPYLGFSILINELNVFVDADFISKIKYENNFIDLRRIEEVKISSKDSTVNFTAKKDILDENKHFVDSVIENKTEKIDNGKIIKVEEGIHNNVNYTLFDYFYYDNDQLLIERDIRIKSKDYELILPVEFASINKKENLV